jgi:PST family polysaccharide transporter
MTDSRNKNFGRILKSSSLLGFASLINVLLGIIRVKVLAVHLGPAFFGTISLYTNFINTIGSITSLGIGQSAVRDIAAAAESGDEQGMARKVAVLHRVVWVTGIVGLIATVGLAIPGSYWIFGNVDHAWAIAILSVIVLLTQIQAGQGALLSGLRRIGDMAKMNIIGGVLSTTLAIVLLLLLGAKGIVPFLIAVAVGQLAASWWYARKVQVERVHVSWRECYYESREMVHLGLSIVVSGIAATLSALLILAILRKLEGESAVGLYQSAYTISSIYVGFILQAMSGDYFPRLAGVANDRVLRNQAVNEQLEMAMLLAVPGLVAVLVVADILIPLLYSSRFDGASEILRWQVLGMLGRIISWPLGFIIMARSDKVFMLIGEWLSATIFVILVWFGVKFFGAVGAGMAFAGEYCWYVVWIGVISKVRHEFVLNKSTRNVILVGFIFVAIAFGATFISLPIWKYVSGILLLTIAMVWSLHSLVERLGYERVMNGLQKFVGHSVRLKLDRALSKFYR